MKLMKFVTALGLSIFLIIATYGISHGQSIDMEWHEEFSYLIAEAYSQYDYDLHEDATDQSVISAQQRLKKEVLLIISEHKDQIRKEVDADKEDLIAFAKELNNQQD